MTDRDKRDARLVQDRTGITYAAALSAVRTFHAVPPAQRVPWLMAPTAAAGHVVDENGRQLLVYACGKQPGPTFVRRSGWEGGGFREVPATEGWGHTSTYHQIGLHLDLSHSRVRRTVKTLLRESVTMVEGMLDGGGYDEATRNETEADLAHCRSILSGDRPVLGGISVPVTIAELTATRRVIEDACDYWVANDYEFTSEPGSLDEWLGRYARSGSARAIGCMPSTAFVRFELPSRDLHRGKVGV